MSLDLKLSLVTCVFIVIHSVVLYVQIPLFRATMVVSQVHTSLRLEQLGQFCRTWGTFEHIHDRVFIVAADRLEECRLIVAGKLETKSVTAARFGLFAVCCKQSYDLLPAYPRAPGRTSVPRSFRSTSSFLPSSYQPTASQFMPKVPSISPATGRSTNGAFIHTTESSFVDNTGRTLLLRGVNLSGSSKAPLDQPSQKLEGFWETAENGGESFIGRPLNLEDADLHLARLRGWGFNMIRFPVTWEALEHEGP